MPGRPKLLAKPKLTASQRKAVSRARTMATSAGPMIRNQALDMRGTMRRLAEPSVGQVAEPIRGRRRMSAADACMMKRLAGAGRPPGGISQQPPSEDHMPGLFVPTTLPAVDAVSILPKKGGCRMKRPPECFLKDIESYALDVLNVGRILQDLGKAACGESMKADRTFNAVIYLGEQLEGHANEIVTSVQWAGEA